MPKPSKPASGRRRPISDGRHTPTRFPQVGELVFLNVNLARQSPSASGVTSSAVIPGQRPEGERNDVVPHPCIVLDLQVFQNSVQSNRWLLYILVTRSYSSYEHDPVEFVPSLPSHEYDRHLPLPPPPSCAPLSTPTAFGSPLEIPMISKKYSWVVAEIRILDMGTNGWVRSIPRNLQMLWSILL